MFRAAISKTRNLTGFSSRHAQFSHGGKKRCCSRSYVQENEVVILKRVGDSRAAPILTRPLNGNGQVKTPAGPIAESSIIGCGIRGNVSAPKGVLYRVEQPTLADYVSLSPRLVTPIYAADASLMVSLLDIHVSPYNSAHNGQKPFEIFEAGTGHGSLTMHLARAIHGANPHPAPSESPRQKATDTVDDVVDPTAESGEYAKWLNRRQAIIHTLDIAEKYSLHARQTVQNFRRGMYYPDIDFHVGSIAAYLNGRLEKSSSEPFLDHVILDLPGSETHLEVASKALKPNGILLAFCPSITQIIKCVQTVKAKYLPLVLDNALELGAGVGVGGREWDIRMVKPRASVKGAMTVRQMAQGFHNHVEAEPNAGVDTLEESSTEDDTVDEKPEYAVVCRPKVGKLVVGGGFVGVWRRMEPR